MLNNLTRKRIAAGVVTLGMAGLLAVPAIAGAQSDTRFGLDEFTDVGIGQEEDLKGTIAQIINIILGFLGIVAVIIILAGGFKWMTAGGNEDKVAESRKMIIQGVIGLVIIFAAWAIASFVIDQLSTATGAT